jgi:hypothetical protein
VLASRVQGELEPGLEGAGVEPRKQATAPRPEKQKRTASTFARRAGSARQTLAASRQFSAGSPSPVNEISTGLPSSGSARNASRTSSSISSAARLRTRGDAAETQKVQPIRQPSWVGMLMIRRAARPMSRAPVR